MTLATCYLWTSRQSVEAILKAGFHDAPYEGSDTMIGVRLTTRRGANGAGGEEGDTTLELDVALTAAELDDYAIKVAPVNEAGLEVGEYQWYGEWLVPAERLNAPTTVMRIIDYIDPVPDWVIAEDRGLDRLPNNLAGEVIGAVRMAIDLAPSEVQADLKAALTGAVLRWSESDLEPLTEAMANANEALSHVPLPVGNPTTIGIVALAIYALLRRQQLGACLEKGMGCW